MNNKELHSTTEKRFVPLKTTEKEVEVELDVDKQISGSLQKIRNSNFILDTIKQDTGKEKGLRLINASAGAGKTYCVIEYCKQKPDETILIGVQDWQLGKELEKKLVKKGVDCQRIEGFERAGCPLMPKYDSNGNLNKNLSQLPPSKKDAHKFWKNSTDVAYTHSYLISKYGKKNHKQNCPYTDQYRQLAGKVIIAPVDLLDSKGIWDVSIDRAFIDETTDRDEKLKFDITKRNFNNFVKAVEKSGNFSDILEEHQMDEETYREKKNLVREFIKDYRKTVKRSSAILNDYWKPGYYQADSIRHTHETPVNPDKDEPDRRLIWQIRTLKIIGDYYTGKVAEAFKQIGKLYRAVMFDLIEDSPSKASSLTQGWIDLESYGRHIKNLYLQPEWYSEKIEKKDSSFIQKQSYHAVEETENYLYGYFFEFGKFKPFKYLKDEDEVWISNFGSEYEKHADSTKKMSHGVVSYRKKSYMEKIISKSNNCHITILDASFKKKDLEATLENYLMREVEYRYPEKPWTLKDNVEPVRLYLEENIGREVVKPDATLPFYDWAMRMKKARRSNDDYEIKIARAKVDQGCPSTVTRLTRKHTGKTNLSKFTRNSELYEDWMKKLRNGEVPELLQDLCDLLNQKRFPDFGLITHRPLYLQLLENDLVDKEDIGYFWGLRGINKFKDKSGLFVLGTPYTSPDSMLFQTTARYGRISGSQSIKNPMSNYKYPLEIEQTVLEMDTHEEIYQAIMRVRPYGSFEKEIYAMCPIPDKVEEEVGTADQPEYLSETVRDRLFEATKTGWKNLTSQILSGKKFDLSDLKQRYDYSEEFLQYVMKRLGDERSHEDMKKVKLKDGKLSRKQNYSYSP